MPERHTGRKAVEAWEPFGDHIGETQPMIPHHRSTRRPPPMNADFAAICATLFAVYWIGFAVGRWSASP